jgi:hypothetical protein
MYAQNVGRLRGRGSAQHVLGEPTIGAHTVAQSSGSISREPAIIEFEDGYWASIVPEDGYSIVSTDLPPILCAEEKGECVFEAIDLGLDAIQRISETLGTGVLRAIMICTRIMGRCAGINIKLFLPLEPERARELFTRTRGEVFKLLADIYGPYNR